MVPMIGAAWRLVWVQSDRRARGEGTPMAATEWNGRKEIGRGMVNHSSPGQIPVSLLDAGSPRPLDAVVAVFRPHVAPLPRATRGTPLPDWRSVSYTHLT